MLITGMTFCHSTEDSSIIEGSRSTLFDYSHNVSSVAISTYIFQS